MTRLDYYLTDNSAAEADDAAYERALDILGDAIEDCGNDQMQLAQLLGDILGDAKAAEVIREYLQGDSDALLERVVIWAGEA